MPKKSKRTSKKATVDKSVKQKQTQNVKQHVVVNVHSPGTGHRRRQSPANTKSFNKGMTYLAGTPFRQSMFPVLQHNIVNPHGEAQAAVTRQFHADMVNRMTALENARNAQLVDQQEARSMVLPNPTQTPTALKPVNMLDVPEELRPQSALPSPQVQSSTQGDEATPVRPLAPREETPQPPAVPAADEAGPSTRNNELFEPDDEDEPEPFNREAYSLRSAQPDEDFLTESKQYTNMTDEEIIKRYRKAYPNKETAGRTMSSLITSLVRDAKKRSSQIKV